MIKILLYLGLTGAFDPFSFFFWFGAKPLNSFRLTPKKGALLVIIFLSYLDKDFTDSNNLHDRLEVKKQLVTISNSDNNNSIPRRFMANRLVLQKA